MHASLITGGSGLLGRALARELVSRGSAARVFDLCPPPEEESGEVEYMAGSVLDERALTMAAEGTEVLYHLAASMPQARLSARGYWEINVGGTLNAARAAARAGCRRLVLASTIEVYGLYYPHEFPVGEDSELRFTGVYSLNKRECEKRLLSFSRRRGLEVSFARMPMIFGPGFYHEKSMVALFRLIARGLPVPVIANPRAPWAAVSSEDAARGLWLCGTRPEARGEAFNLAAADAPACEDALSELIRRAGSRSRLIKFSPRFLELVVSAIERYEFLPTPGELARFALTGGVYSIEKAGRMLGYRPCHGTVDALESAFNYLARVRKNTERK